ncbi:MAG: hypothetical protein WA715_26580, partial [Candidatus Acidiferrum sp.]
MDKIEPKPVASGVSRKKTPQDVFWGGLWGRPNVLHCSAEWHMQDMNSRLVHPVYTLGRRLSKQSERFYASVGTLAHYFFRDRTTIIRAISELVNSGWAKAIDREPGKPVTYRFVSHQEWAKDHPGCCIEKDSTPGASEGDPLGRLLHSLSSGRAKFLPNQMQGLRKFKFTDEEVAIEFEKFLNLDRQRGSNWKRVYYRFHAYLADAADEVASGPNSSNNQSLQRNTHQSLQRNTPYGARATPTSRASATQVFEVNSRREDVGIGKRAIPASPSAHAAACLTHPLEPKGAAPPSTPAKNEE